VYRLGFAASRDEARQTVRHNHILVNEKRVNIPSYRVRPGDVVAVAEKAKDMSALKAAIISSARVEVPGWLQVDVEKLQGKVLALPAREHFDPELRVQLIVELYSK
jgi:small subunit ribosomal protein S4